MTAPQAFYKSSLVVDSTWQGLERLVVRLLTLKNFEHVWLVGGTGDEGADIIATMQSRTNGQERRWLVQVKRYKSPVGEDVAKETIRALLRYEAHIPVIVSSSGFTASVHKWKEELRRSQGISLQLWDASTIESLGRELPTEPLIHRPGKGLKLRKYQEDGIARILERYTDRYSHSALVVLATGLGKTVTAAEAVRRIRAQSPRPLRVLVIAHTIDLVHQLERSFWPFMSPEDASCIVGGGERPSSYDELLKYAFVFAVRDSIFEAQERSLFPNEIFDIVVVDECHHLGSRTYEAVLDGLEAGTKSGPFLIGLTATPWRPGGESLGPRFDDPVVQVDLPTGLRDGFLANVDYRMYTDNVDWARLAREKGDRFTPEKINRTLFISEWDDGVIERTQEAWAELKGVRRGIVFCGTIEHANTVSEKINQLGFATAATISSKGADGKAMKTSERSRILWDFAAGKIEILCARDVLNEGIDVPDVNLVVFQRVTHSRRIFVQQLGRGLRLKPNDGKVIVLDFVTDIRRFAEGLLLGKALDQDGPRPGDERYISQRSKVTFMRQTEEDFDSKNFLTQWLRDMEEVASAGEDASVLAFPPLTMMSNRFSTPNE